ncbi:MAG: hypothetical protein AB2L09_02065 [Coriobacteriia bacterium]
MRVPVVLVAIALLMSLSGCVPGVDTTTPPSTSVGQGVETTSSDSSDGLLANDAVPSNLRSSLEDGRPILVFFYDERSAVSQENKQIIDAFLAENIGLVDSYSYELDSSGTIDLAGLLGVSEVPAVVVIDRSGEVSYLRSGLVDQEFLSREIFSAAK